VSCLSSGYRLATVSPEGVRWQLRRNCSLSPAEMSAVLAALAMLSLAVAGFFWLQGATLVLPFAVIEVVALAVALFVFAKHATDTERISLVGGALLVEREIGGKLDRVAFASEWVRIDAREPHKSLVCLSGQGRSVSVGRYLRPDLRPLLAREIRQALRGRGQNGSGIGGGFSPSEKRENLV
jgi:uncharacterized membrane protein